MTGVLGTHAPLHIALLGPPNVGKTCLFNALTGMFHRVGNYPGVTVEKSQGTFSLDGRRVFVTDLPGTPSLIAVSPDEEVVVRFLTEPGSDRPDLLVVVLDATQFRRGLYFLSQVLEFRIPLVVCLNMIDEARKAGLGVSASAIAGPLGVPCFETVASTGEGLEELRHRLVDPELPAVPRRPWTFPPEVEREFRERPAPGILWTALRDFVGADPRLRSLETMGRYRWAESLVGHTKAHQRHDAIDRLVLHPWLGPVLFITIMGLVFQSLFTWAVPAMEAIEGVFSVLGVFLRARLGEGLLADLVVDGALAGVGAVVVFLPQILLLFFFIGLLEDTGYMSRAAFLVDRPLSLVGLSGRSFIPLLSSYACAIPGIMAARTVPSPIERFKTIFIAPLMTCSARLPVYTLFIAAFVPDRTVAGFLSLHGLVLLVLYAAGLLGAVVFARLLALHQGPCDAPMILELPPYRRPTFRVIAMRLWLRTTQFLKRAGTIICAASIAIWVLLSFPRIEPQPGMSPEQAQAEQVRQSYAGRIGRTIEPLIAPLGYDWKIGIGLVASIAAREVFVGTMGVVFAVGEVDEGSSSLRTALRESRNETTGAPLFTLPVALSLLAFYVFALMCVSTLAIVGRETGSWKVPLIQLVVYGAVAYAAAWLTSTLTRSLMG